MKKMLKSRKAFSLVELVVVILIIAILAVAVFAGGSAAIKKSQVSRTTSDLHNFSVAIEAAVNATPKVANMQGTGDEGDVKNAPNFAAIVKAVNANLSADYQLGERITADVSGVNLNIDTQKGSAGTGSTLSKTYAIYKSAKLDAWDNPYYVVFDCGERHCKGQSDFFVTVISAGPNAQTTIGGKIEADDIFLLVQYSDGDVSAVTYNCAEGGLKVTTDIAGDTTTTFNVKDFAVAGKALVTKGNIVEANAMFYAGGADNKGYTASNLPVNF